MLRQDSSHRGKDLGKFLFSRISSVFLGKIYKKTNFLTGFLISERTKKNFIFCVTSLMELLKKSENKNL